MDAIKAVNAGQIIVSHLLASQAFTSLQGNLRVF